MKKLLNAAASAAVTALLLSGSSLASAAPATVLPDADPAMWVVKDADTTIYLFGTFHALDGKTEWLNDEVRTAFDSADELVLEMIPPAEPAAIQAITKKFAIDPSGKPLSGRLSAAGRAALTKKLGEMGAPPTALDTMRPMFAAMVLTMADAGKLGLTGEHGSEAVLTKAAKAASKPIGTLETMESQLKMMADLPDAVQIEMLEQSLAHGDSIKAMFEQMKTHWNAGDAEGFAKMMHDMSVSSPEAYDAIFSRRNALWAEWVDQRLDKPGTVFVAVGTGHLAGKNSVQDLLAKRGIKSADAN